MNDEILEEPGQEGQPADLAEALKMLREGNQPAASAAVDGQGVGQGGGMEGQEGAEGEAVPDAGEGVQGGEVTGGGQGQPPVPGGEQGDLGAGGPPAGEPGAAEVPVAEAEPAEVSYDQTDYSDVMGRLAKSVARQAAIDTNRMFADNGIKQLSIGDLYRQDPNSGRVSFENPDDPQRPFSSRQEAQAWVDAFNKEYEAQWKQQAAAMQRKYMQDTAPAMRLMQFAPTYDAMPKHVQDVFDAIIEPYSVRDSSGMTIGFSCDLGAAKAQAEKLADMFGPKAEIASPTPQQQAPAATGPALDMTTSGSQEKPKEEVPRNLNEAMKLYNKKKKEAGNGK